MQGIRLKGDQKRKILLLKLQQRNLKILKRNHKVRKPQQEDYFLANPTKPVVSLETKALKLAASLETKGLKLAVSLETKGLKLGHYLVLEATKINHLLKHSKKKIQAISKPNLQIPLQQFLEQIGINRSNRSI